MCHSIYAQERLNATGIRAGVNFSDLNYGHELLQQILPGDEYELLSTGGDGALGFLIGVEQTRIITPRLSVEAGLAYTQLNYDIEGTVSDKITPGPPDPDVPISAEGAMHYHFLNADVRLNYAVGGKFDRGLHIWAQADGLFNIGRSWDLDLVNEDMVDDTNDDISTVSEPSYNPLWTLGIGVGYAFPVGDAFSITPELIYQFGMNSIVDDTVNPSVLTLSVQFRKWY